MSNKIERETVCRRCGQPIKAVLYPRITVPNDLKLRGRIMDETLFDAECPQCKALSQQLSYNLLYTDLKRRFMVYLMPRLDGFCAVDDELENEFSHLAPITKRAVSNVNALKEKIYCFENSLDDMALELTKLAVSRTVAAKFGVSQVREGYLSVCDTQRNSMGFLFFVGENKEPYLQSARLELYSKAARIAAAFAQKDRQRQGFLKIDREWADNMIYRYNSKKQNPPKSERG